MRLEEREERVVRDVAGGDDEQPLRRSREQVSVPEVAVLRDDYPAVGVRALGDLAVRRAVAVW
jgi:hypothetical protein